MTARIPYNVWRQIAPAKQKLIQYGPTTPGRDAFMYAAIAVAAELRLQGIPEEDAVAVVRAMPFIEGTTKARDVFKSAPDFVGYAYHPPDGEPILSGCAAESQKSDGRRGRLRSAFEDYCDSECRLACRMRKGVLVPEAVLVGSAYEPILASTVWRSLGSVARQVWCRMAAIAAASPEDSLWASRRWIVGAFNGTLSQKQVFTALSKLRKAGLVAVENNRTGHRQVFIFSREEVAELEQRLGSADAAAWIVRTARSESLDQAINFPSWDVKEALRGGR